MSNKIDFFGYEGKMTYENQNSGIRTFQMDIDLLHKINSFTLNVMKEEEFKPKDVIRDFRMTSNGDFSFKCGGGYKISDELVGGDASGVMSKTFEYFLEYDKDKDIKDLDRLNEFIDENKDHIRRMFPNAEKFEGFNKEYDFTEEKIVDLELEKGKISVKTEILDDLEECSLKYRDKNGKITENETKEMVIPNTDLEKYFKKEMEYRDNFINFKVYNKNGEEIFDRNTYKNSNVYEKIDNFKEVQDLFRKYIDDDLFYFSSKSDYNTWERFVENEDVIVTYENKKTGELISDYSKENYSNLVFERKKDSVLKEEISEVKAILEYHTDEKTRVTNSKDFNELRDDYAKNVRSLTRLIEDLEKENQKNKIIPKEKETEVETDNEEKDFSL